MNTFTDFFYTIFGEYEPCIVEGASEPATNWGYILAVVMLLLFTFCMLKTIGGIIHEWCRK